MLIDAGESDDYNEISSILQSEGVRTVDVMLLTHFDKDHVGSAADLLHNDAVQKAYLGS